DISLEHEGEKSFITRPLDPDFRLDLPTIFQGITVTPKNHAFSSSSFTGRSPPRHPACTSCSSGTPSIAYASSTLAQSPSSFRIASTASPCPHDRNQRAAGRTRR